MIARSRTGDIEIFPWVESHQENSRCLWVKGPVKINGQASIEKKLRALVEDLKYVGILGVEFFDTGKELIVNELAPRVHNSAHYSLDALDEDQFTTHIKCVLGMKLSSPKLLAKGFAMYNLLGTHERSPKWELPQDVNLHWYGKADNRPGRKMGHFTILSSTPDRALELAKMARKRFDV